MPNLIVKTFPYEPVDQIQVFLLAYLSKPSLVFLYEWWGKWSVEAISDDKNMRTDLSLYILFLIVTYWVVCTTR